MNKSDGIKVVIIVIALVGAAALIAWNMGVFGGGGSGGGTVSGGEVTQSGGDAGSDSSNEELGEGERRTISDGFTPPGKF